MYVFVCACIYVYVYYTHTGDLLCESAFSVHLGHVPDIYIYSQCVANVFLMYPNESALSVHLGHVPLQGWPVVIYLYIYIPNVLLTFS